MRIHQISQLPGHYATTIAPLEELAAAAGYRVESSGKLPLLRYVLAVRPYDEDSRDQSRPDRAQVGVAAGCGGGELFDGGGQARCGGLAQSSHRRAGECLAGRGLAAFLDTQKPANTTAEVDTSGRLWIASPSSATDPLTSTITSSTAPGDPRAA